MKIDYETIGALAAEIGCRRDDLIALSSGNDPFYVDVPSRKSAAEWFANQWQALGFQTGSHPRRLHYNLVSQPEPIIKPDGTPYQNTENDWKYLIRSSLAARYLRLIPDGALADHRNDPPIIHCVNLGTATPKPWVLYENSSYLLADLPKDDLEIPYLAAGELKVAQPYLVEVWVEKSTQNDILVPLAQKHGFNIVSGTGETSEILARQAVERAISDGRPMRILYISDFDPGGRSMPVALARKIEFWLHQADIDLDITLDPIVLTPDQCERYNLPRTPLKETERRAAKFEDRFGAGATELDALEAIHPGELARIVSDEVGRYIDPTLDSRTNAVRWDFSRKVGEARERVIARYDLTEVQDRYTNAVNDYVYEMGEIEQMTDELWPVISADLKANAPMFDPAHMPQPRPATPPAEPLFDSSRDYLTQIDHYRRWQGKGEAA